MVPGKQYSFDSVLQLAWRRKWLVALPAILIAGAGVWWARQLPNIYRSDTLILVVPQRVPESYVKSTVTSRIEDRLQTISQQILSRTRLEQIVQDFNLYPQERKQQQLMEDIVTRMRTSDISIDVVKGDAFRVSYSASDPRTAMRVTERLASLFIDESLRDREVLAEGTNEFLAAQLDEARRNLVLNEKKLEEYQHAHNGELPSQMAANLEGLHNAEMASQNLGETLNRDLEHRLLLERTVSDLVDEPPADLPKPAGAAATAEVQQSTLDELKTSQQALLALELKLKPEHPDVKRLRRTVEELKKRAEAEALQGEITAKPVRAAVTLDPAKRKRLTDARAELENLDRSIQAKQSEQNRLRGVMADYQSRIEAAPARESELAALTRDYETLQQSYRGLLSKKEESQISANLERRQIGEQFKVLDPARMPEKPASPDRPRLYLITVLAGLAVGVMLAAAAEFFDRTLRSESDVRAALSLPVLATVPNMRERTWFAWRRRSVAHV